MHGMYKIRNSISPLLTHLTVSSVAASFIFRYFQPLYGEQRINRSQAF